MSVNMTLSKRGDYVVRSALCLARAHPSGSHRKIREVVAEMDVPQTFASQILADLVRSGLATSKAGKGGGYLLARPPASITLLEVIEAGEGTLRSERCALGEGPCRWETVCPLHETWTAATLAFREALAKTTLAALVSRDEALEQGRYPTPSDSHRHGGRTVAIEDWVQVEAGHAPVLQRLARAESWLPACLKAGYREAEALRKGIDPSGLPWATGAMPVVSVKDPKTGDGIDLTWEAGSARVPASRFEGVLETRALDTERTEIRLRGRFRPPIPLATDDAKLAERLSRATVRSALRKSAQVLEESS